MFQNENLIGQIHSIKCECVQWACDDVICLQVFVPGSLFTLKKSNKMLDA